MIWMRMIKCLEHCFSAISVLDHRQEFLGFHEIGNSGIPRIALWVFFVHRVLNVGNTPHFFALGIGENCPTALFRKRVLCMAANGIPGVCLQMNHTDSPWFLCNSLLSTIFSR